MNFSSIITPRYNVDKHPGINSKKRIELCLSNKQKKQTRNDKEILSLSKRYSLTPLQKGQKKIQILRSSYEGNQALDYGYKIDYQPKKEYSNVSQSSKVSKTKIPSNIGGV